jgi:hypothetical protein
MGVKPRDVLSTGQDSDRDSLAEKSKKQDMTARAAQLRGDGTSSCVY